MNTGKKKWAILLIIALVIGTGSYVFANPSLDSSKDTLNSNHSVDSENNQQNKENNTNGNIDVVINQADLNIEDLDNMNVPDNETQILEQIIANASNGTANENGSTVGNVVNSVPGNENNGTGSNVSGNNSGNNNSNNPGYVPPGNTGSNGNTGGNNTGSGSNTGSGNTGTGTNTGGSSSGSTSNPGNSGGNNTDSGSNNGSGSNTGSGSTGEGNNPGDSNPGVTLPSFVFEENGSFSTNTIVINDPNYDHMIVYNWNTGDRDVTYETEYTIEVDNAVYIFIVYDKEGNYHGFTMHHVKAETE